MIEHGTAYPSDRGTLALVCPRHAEELEFELRARRWPTDADRAAGETARTARSHREALSQRCHQVAGTLAQAQAEQVAERLAPADAVEWQAGIALEALSALAYKNAKNGFTVPGLGKLVLVNRKARMGRNPATGETIQIKAKKVVKFRVAKAAKDALAAQGKRAILWDYNKSFFSWPLLAGAGGQIFGRNAQGDFDPAQVGVSPLAAGAGQVAHCTLHLQRCVHHQLGVGEGLGQHGLHGGAFVGQ